MGRMKDLDIARQNMLDHRGWCPPKLPSDRPNALDHITNAINHLELFVKPSCDDVLSMNYLLLQLHLAIHKMEGPTQ
jgi:hypothetical protein